jgi:hypothetical protein
MANTGQPSEVHITRTYVEFLQVDMIGSKATPESSDSKVTLSDVCKFADGEDISNSDCLDSPRGETANFLSA